jgi:membrane protease YdiL (CAAX protease family)
VLYVRTDASSASASGSVEAHAAADLAAEGGNVRVTAETPVSMRESGPFAPLARAVVSNGPLRDELAAAIATPSLRGFSRLRWGLLALTAAPMAMLLELDRELFGGARSVGHLGLGRAVVDLVLVATVCFELSRRTPRMPGIASIALAAVALRWCLVAARLCGGTRGPHPAIYLAAAVPALASVVLLAKAPAPSRVALELLGKLGISRSSFLAATTPPEPSGALIAAAVAVAAALPAILHLTHMFGAGLLAQAVLFVVVAIVGPLLARRLGGAPAAVVATDRTTEDAHLLTAIAFGFALAAASVTAARLFFDSGTELARCFGRLDDEARRARAAESAELVRAATNVRTSPLLIALTATVFPFAEERIYRGLLQDALVRKYGRAYGIFAASMAFGLAHLGVYHVALYQTVLLGMGFGLAYAEGGLAAAFCVHATWNVLQLAS